jgi:hypothetical protein
MKLIDARKKVHGWDKPPTAGMLTPAISYRSPVKCIAFYKGERISDHVLDWIVELATYGYITEAGKNLYLIPIKLYQQACRDQQAKADKHAKQRRKKKPNFKSGPASPSIKKSDCIPLTSFLPQKGAGNKVRLCESRVLSPLISRLPEGANRNASTLGHVPVKRNGTCLHCGEVFEPRRSDAKYCSKACKQAAYRSRTHK